MTPFDGNKLERSWLALSIRLHESSGPIKT